MFFCHLTPLQFHRETESNICQRHCLIQVQLVGTVFKREHLGSKTASCLVYETPEVSCGSENQKIRKGLLVHKPCNEIGVSAKWAKSHFWLDYFSLMCPLTNL